MTYADVAKFCNLPVKAIAELYKDQILNQMPPNTVELSALRLLAATWGRDRYIKMQLSRHTKFKRRMLSDSAGLTKPESFAFNRFMMQRVEQSTFGTRSLTIEEVVEEINYNYKVPINYELRAMVRKMRWRSYKVNLSDPVFVDESGRMVKRSVMKKLLERK